jgi:hypothetical protein
MSVPGESPRSMHNSRAARFRDIWLPDIHGAQLLGVGYRGRVPVPDDWELVPVSESGSLLLHRDPAAWFHSEPDLIAPTGAEHPVLSDMPESLRQSLMSQETLPPFFEQLLGDDVAPDSGGRARATARRQFEALIYDPDVALPGAAADPLAMLESIRG